MTIIIEGSCLQPPQSRLFGIVTWKNGITGALTLDERLLSAAVAFKTSTDWPFHRGVHCSERKEMEIKRMFATKVLFKKNFKILPTAVACKFWAHRSNGFKRKIYRFLIINNVRTKEHALVIIIIITLTVW